MYEINDNIKSAEKYHKCLYALKSKILNSVLLCTVLV